MAERRVERHQLHYGWDHATEPCLVVAPGDVVEFDTLDSSGGQISPTSTVEDIARFDFAKVNPAFGPVFVEGAQPGDALQVTVLDLQTADWGWTANIPGFGLLAGGFTEPALHLWQLDPETLAPATYAPGGRVPLKPFPGIMGLAPHEPGLHSVVNPRRVGGNIDTRDIAVGSTLLLPVEVAGALFSCGDGHAAQGDGEICGVALETPMRITVRLDLLRDAHVRWPRFTTPGPVTRHLDEQRLRGDDGHRAGPARGGLHRRAGDGPAHQRGACDERARRLSAVQRVRRPAHQRGRRRARLDRVPVLSAGRVRLRARHTHSERAFPRKIMYSVTHFT